MILIMLLRVLSRNFGKIHKMFGYSIIIRELETLNKNSITNLFILQKTVDKC